MPGTGIIVQNVLNAMKNGSIVSSLYSGFTGHA